MKKLILLLLFIPLKLLAPAEREITIPKVEGITNPYKRIIDAIGAVECSGDTMAYNPIEKATGYFQVRPIRLKDYNQRTGEKLTLKDMFIYEKAERVFLYYASDFNPSDFEAISKEWNKSVTDIYWNKVNKLLSK